MMQAIDSAAGPLPLTATAADGLRPSGSGQIVSIGPPTRWPAVNARELWQYRGLFFFLVWRDIKSRYSQTVLGAGWAVLQPVLAMIVFTTIFGRFARIPSDGVPYEVFSLAALVPWTYFATALTSSSQSLVMNSALVTKVYFPRLVIPSAAVLSCLVDFTIAFMVLLLVMLYYQFVPPPLAVLLIPGLVAIVTITAIGVGCWLSALNIQYRDVRHLTPFLLQIWMYGSPIVYPLSMVPEQYRAVYALNPMAGAIAAFRAVLLGRNPVPWSLLGISLASAILIFVSGALYFRYTERVFADVA
jgi:lipopolysaccharide transport system permease protein